MATVDTSYLGAYEFKISLGNTAGHQFQKVTKQNKK